MYYKPMTIINDDSRVVNKLEATLTDDIRVVHGQTLAYRTNLGLSFQL